MPDSLEQNVKVRPFLLAHLLLNLAYRYLYALRILFFLTILFFFQSYWIKYLKVLYVANTTPANTFFFCPVSFKCVIKYIGVYVQTVCS